MKKSVNPIKEALSSALVAAGFKKKSDTWYLENDQTICLVNLQQSQYGKRYYANFGVGLKKLGIAAHPKEQHCHIRFRLSAIIPDAELDECAGAFDLENEIMADDDRKTAISDFVVKHGVPLLKACSSLDGIRAACHDGRLRKAMVHKAVKDLIG